MEDDFLGLDSSMRGPVVASTILHILLFVITAVGLPFIAQERDVISQPISVEIVALDKITQTTRVAEPIKPKEEKKDLPPPKQEKPSPPKMAEETPPDLSKPAPPDIKEETKTPPVEKLAIPKPEKKPEIKPKDKPKPPKPEVTKTEEKKAAQDFDSLLKNLTPDTKEEQPVDAPETAVNSSVDSAVAPLADRLTMSEMDALKHQLEGCWNLGASAGGSYAEGLIVDVRVLVRRDRTVEQAFILDQSRYNRDTHFRAAADAALRALRNPRCIPLALPPEKYNEWKTTVIRFDPSEML